VRHRYRLHGEHAGMGQPQSRPIGRDGVVEPLFQLHALLRIVRWSWVSVLPVGRRAILAFTDRMRSTIRDDLPVRGLLVEVIVSFPICPLAECGVSLILLLGFRQTSGLAGELRVFSTVPRRCVLLLS